MVSQVKIEEIEERYKELMKKLEELGAERQEIIRGYIKELEAKKVSDIRESLGLLDNNQK